MTGRINTTLDLLLLSQEEKVRLHNDRTSVGRPWSETDIHPGPSSVRLNRDYRIFGYHQLSTAGKNLKFVILSLQTNVMSRSM